MIRPIENLLTAVTSLLLATALHAAEYPARLQWAGIHEISVPVEAVVKKLAVVPGQRVEQGQLLLQLHSEPFDYRRQLAQAQVEALQPELDDARRERNDARALYEQTVLSDVEMQAAEIRYRSLQARMRQARARLKLAQWESSWTRLHAPATARVIAVSARPGQVIAGDLRSQPLLLLADAEAMLASAVLPAAEAMKLKPGDSVAVEFAGREHAATVQAIDMQADSQGRLEVRARFSPRQPTVAGMAATLITP